MAHQRRQTDRRTLHLPASLPGLHALFTTAVAHAFDTLRVGAALREKAQWYAIHIPGHPITEFELAHGKESERNAYNERCLKRAFEFEETVLGQHGGFSDLFVPIASDGNVHAVLVVGPFATARPTSHEILERWHDITGRHGHPSDPEFSYYLSVTLSTLLLEGEQLSRFRRMIECLASLSAARGDARSLAAEASAHREALERTRIVDRMWEAARSMVDPRTSAAWLSAHSLDQLDYLGAVELPQHALVGLTLGSRTDPNALEEILRMDAFQRACVDLARRAKNVICGRIADQGVVFLLAGARAKGRARDTLADLGARVREMARRRFGLALHFGMSVHSDRGALSLRYEEALGAAQRALSEGAALVVAEPEVRHAVSPLRQLREQLANLRDARTASSKFERYIEAVGTYCGYRFDLAQAHLEGGFEQAARSLGALDPRSRLALFDALDRGAHEASTVSELFALYRRGFADLVNAAERPVLAAQDRNLRRAIEHIHQHFSEPLSLRVVSRIAGFAPGYFCQLFKLREHMTFEQYVRRLRVERAQQLLRGTQLSVERVGQLCGFSRRFYFHRVFQTVSGMTPVQFRSSQHS